MEIAFPEVVQYSGAEISSVIEKFACILHVLVELAFLYVL